MLQNLIPVGWLLHGLRLLLRLPSPRVSPHLSETTPTLVGYASNTTFTLSLLTTTSNTAYESRDDPSLDFQALCLRTPIRNAHRHILESSHSDLSLTSWPCSHNLEPMLIGSYLAGLVILSIVPLLFFIARYLAKRTKSQSWNIDDTLLLLALVTKDTILSPRLANASWEAVPICCCDNVYSLDGR